MEERPMGKALGKERPAGKGPAGQAEKKPMGKGPVEPAGRKGGAMERDLLGESAAAAEGWKGAWPLLSLATGGASRARGLLCAGPSEDALLLAPCRDIHTVGMRRPIDVAFVDKTGRDVEAHRAVGPLRRLRNASAAAVIERFAACGPWFQPGDRVGLSCVRAVQRAERIEDAGPPPQGRRARGARKAHGGRRAPAARKADGGCRGAAKAEKREVEERRQP